MIYQFAHFEKPNPKVETLTGKKCIYYWTREPIVRFDIFGNEDIIPEGVVSDGYSVPKLLWGITRGLNSILPPIGHDFDYWMQLSSRSVADRNLYLAILSLNGSRVSAAEIRAGLWLGGWVAWNRYSDVLADIGRDEVLRLRTAHTLSEACDIANKFAA